MRKVFSSARIENAEAVARMLEAEGIEVRIEHGSTFRRAIRGNFSYRAGADNGPKPTVWVIRSEDQPRARQMLRDAGLLDAATTVPNTFLPDTLLSSRDVRGDQLAKRRSARFRYGLLIIIAVFTAAIVFKPRPDGPPPGTRPAATVAAPIDPSLDQIDTAPRAIFMIAVPPALAAAVARLEAEQRGVDKACLGIESRDPPEDILAIARAAGLELLPRSACDGESLRVEVFLWRTDGSGSGQVSWSVGEGRGEGRTRSATAQRVDDDWHVGEPR
jgi:hypothetical protein